MKKIYIIFLFCICFFSSGVSFGYYYNTYTQKIPCFQTYGMFAIDNFDGTCSCMAGYTWGTDVLGETRCVDANQKCQEDYGFGAKSSGGNRCSCKYGYVWGTNTFGETKCVDANQKCREDHGIWAISSGDGYCSCVSGYTMKKDVLGDMKCVKKQLTVYFYLKEVKGDDAIIYSDYEKQSYKIKLGLCPMLDTYLEKNIVINLGTDKMFNYGDYLVQQDHDRSCEIWNIEPVADTFTLKSCSEIYGYGAIEKGVDRCVCKEGYEWNINKDQCIMVLGPQVSSSVVSNTPPLGLPVPSWEQAKNSLGDKVKILEGLVPVIRSKDAQTQTNIKALLEQFKLSTDSYTRNIGIYLSYLLN